MSASIKSVTMAQLAVVTLMLLIGCLALGIMVWPPMFSAVDFPAWGGDWSKFVCKLRENNECGALSKFPVAYLAVSFIVSLLGGGSASKVLLFSLNVAFLLLPVALAFRILDIRLAKAGTLLYTAAILSSVVPPFYLYSGGLEVQSGVILGLFVVLIVLSVVYRQKSTLFVPALFLCSLVGPWYKDTNILVMCAAICSVYAWRAKASGMGFVKTFVAERKLVIAFAFGALIAIIVAVAYNYLRYASYLPVPYMVEAAEASPDLRLSSVYFLASIFSPSGGVLVAWSLSVCVLFIIGRSVGYCFSRGALWLAAGILLLQLGAFSRWWTPFGWEGWGNRLIIPAAIAGLIIVIFTGSRHPKDDLASMVGREALLKRGWNNWFVTLLCVPLFLVSGSYVIRSYSKERDLLLDQSMWGSDACQAMRIVRAKYDSWAFKRTDVHRQCHFERFQYWPGKQVKVLPMAIVNAGQRVEIKAGNSGGVLGRGWSELEEWGVWSEGNVAEIRFVPSSAVERLSLELQPFVAGSLTSQGVKIYVDDVEVDRVELVELSTVTVQLSNPNVFDGKKLLSLRLHLPQAASPQSLGVNSDQRRIAVGLRAVSFE